MELSLFVIIVKAGIATLSPGSKVSPFHLKLIVVVAELYHGILYANCLYKLRAEKSCVTVSGNASRMFLSML